jgi:hypothetical protein
MSRIRADVLAVCCIVGGAAAGGAATLAFVVSPDVRVHALEHCDNHADQVVQIHVERHLDQLDSHLEHLDEALEFQMQALEETIEAEVAAELEAIEIAVEMDQARVEARAEMEEAVRAIRDAAVRVKVEKVGGGGR